MLQFCHDNVIDVTQLALIQVQSVEQKVKKDIYPQTIRPQKIMKAQEQISTFLQRGAKILTALYDEEPVGFMVFNQPPSIVYNIHILGFYATRVNPPHQVGKSLLKELIISKPDMIDLSLISAECAIQKYKEDGFDLEQLAGMKYMDMSPDNIMRWRNAPPHEFPVFL